jgi:hypothetical protein
VRQRFSLHGIVTYGGLRLTGHPSKIHASIVAASNRKIRPSRIGISAPESTSRRTWRSEQFSRLDRSLTLNNGGGTPPDCWFESADFFSGDIARVSSYWNTDLTYLYIGWHQ